MRWINEEVEFLKKNYHYVDKNILEENLNHSWIEIKNYACLTHLKRDNRTILPVNQDFFKNWNEDSAYLLGFLCADSSLSNKKFYISFSSSDIELIHLIKFRLKAKQKINGPCGRNYTLIIGSKIMYNDLLKLGITPQKSLTLQFPKNIPDEYLSHFIRGEFDGDGSFYIQKSNKKKNRYLNASVIGNVDFLTILKNKLKNNNIESSGLYRVSNNKPNYSNRIYDLRYFSKQAIKLGDFMYQGSENLRLERKYNVYKKFKQNVK